MRSTAEKEHAEKVADNMPQNHGTFTGMNNEAEEKYIEDMVGNVPQDPRTVTGLTNVPTMGAKTKEPMGEVRKADKKTKILGRKSAMRLAAEKKYAEKKHTQYQESIMNSACGGIENIEKSIVHLNH